MYLCNSGNHQDTNISLGFFLFLHDISFIFNKYTELSNFLDLKLIPSGWHHIANLEVAQVQI